MSDGLRFVLLEVTPKTRALMESVMAKVGTAGPIPIMVSKYCPPDMVVLLSGSIQKGVKMSVLRG